MNYYNVGKMLNETGKHYREGIIKNIQLIEEVDKKYNTTNLKRMRQFYRMIEKGPLSGTNYKSTTTYYRRNTTNSK